MNKLKSIWHSLMSHQLYRMVNLVIYVFYFVPSDYGVDYYLYILSFFWGIVIIGWDFFTKRLMFKQPYWYLLFAVCISYGISIVTNFPTNLVNNGMNLVYLAISFFIFYTVDLDVDNEKRKNDLRRMNDTYIVISFILGIVSLAMFAFNISYYLEGGVRQGFMENRLFGVFTSPNIMSMFGYTSVFLMIFNNHLKRGKWNKFQTFYILNIIVQYICYLLSSSRGTQLALLGFVAILFLIIALKALVTKKDRVKNIGATFFFLVGITFSISYIGNTIEEGLSYIPSFVSSTISQEETTVVIDEEGKEQVVRKKEPIKRIIIQHSPENAEVSSGRFSIWKAGLKLVQQRPFFGVADSYVYRSGELSEQIDESNLTDIDKSELRRAHGNMHNTYIAILVKGGVISFILLSIFVILTLKDNYQFLMNKEVLFSQANIQIYIITLAFILSLFVNDLVENHVIFNNRDVLGMVFWSYLGILNHERMTKTESIKIPKQANL